LKVFGFDPGGSQAGFGCAMLDTVSNSCTARTVYSVDEAIEWATSFSLVPDAAGIDTLLFWQSTRSGWRGADRFLRKAYPEVSQSVVPANALYGSMAVQGAVLAHRLRERWPEIKLTETHPKVLWAHYSRDTPYPREWGVGEPETARAFKKQCGLASAEPRDEHQFDALLSAWAAAQAFDGRWAHDLSYEKAEDQTGDNISVVSKVHYYWPI
jgi:hypothetical protein